MSYHTVCPEYIRYTIEADDDVHPSDYNNQRQCSQTDQRVEGTCETYHKGIYENPYECEKEWVKKTTGLQNK